jgi:flagellar biosynthesis anti-sigma factor FlgM
MTNGISNTGPLGPNYANPVETRVEQSKSPTATANEETLAIGITAQQLDADPGFDAAKVAAIKQAITDGNYPLDARKIAESFAALEKMVDSAVSLDRDSGL